MAVSEADKKERRRAHNKKYRLSHKEALRAYDVAYSLAHKEKKRAYRAAHKRERAAYNLVHKEEQRAYKKAYDESHRDQKTDRCARRRAIKRVATAETVSRQAVYGRDGGRCHICGKKVQKKGWHLDHLIPLFHGGEHSYKNVAVSCPECNMSKGTKLGVQLRIF